MSSKIKTHLFKSDIFGDPITEESVEISIYADEIQEVEDIVTGEKWIYMAAIYERNDRPILDDLVHHRFRKNLDNWEKFQEKNNTNIHWTEIKDSHDKKHIINRWLEYILSDCFKERKFYFSILGINLNNLNTEEFGKKQNFNSIYNRFFRSMLGYSLKKFFSGKVTIKNIFHEEGQQMHHEYFDWHTIFKLDKDENFNFNCSEIEFLPKSHRDDERSNIIQLCDVLVGIFKDLHLGVDQASYSNIKSEILKSETIEELLLKRVIRLPKNTNSSFGYHNRFHISLFPNKKSDADSMYRHLDNFYDVSKILLKYHTNFRQQPLF